MTYLIIGLGVSGISCARYLLKKNKKVCAYDDEKKVWEKDTVKELCDQGLESFTQDLPIAQAIVSPGISLQHGLIKELLEKSIPVTSEMEFGLKKCANIAIGVTATNGKTTVCSLMEHVFQVNNIAAIAVGNIGMPITEYLLKANPEEILIVELSSFQLESLQGKHFEQGLIINISPHHLDRYESFASYAKTKLNLQNFVRKKMYLSKSVVEQFGNLVQNYEQIPQHIWPDLSLPKENLDATFYLCLEYGIDKKRFMEALRTYRRWPHRLEKLATIKGVSYFNDSKATNVQAVIQAIASFPKNVILIAGGYDCLSCFTSWKEPFRAKVKKIIAMGQSAKKISQTLADSFDVIITDDLQGALNIACRYAKKHDVVLFSPGCPSFDAYKSYIERGNAFKRLVESLKEREI